MLRIKVIDYACTGCGTCLDSCMMDVFRMRKRKAYAEYIKDCQACFLCIEDCPRDAILMIEDGSPQQPY